MDVFPPLLFSWSFVSAHGRLREFRVRRIRMEDQDLSSFLAACAKQFCPWCGTRINADMTFGIMKNGIRPKR